MKAGFGYQVGRQPVIAIGPIWEPTFSTSSVHGFSASYVALRNKAEISPVVEYFTLESLLQEIIQLLCTFTCNNEANLSPISLAFRRKETNYKNNMLNDFL